MLKKMTIEKLAQMTAEQFFRVDERFDTLEAKVDAGFSEMKTTLKTVLDVVLDIPSKKAFNRLETKVDTMDVRLTSVEKRIK